MASHLHLAPSLDAAPATPLPDGRISVVLGADHAFVSRAVRLLLDNEDGVDVIDEAGDLATIAPYLQKRAPRVLVLDLNMPNGSGLAAISGLHEQTAKTEIVVMRTDDSPVFARRAFASGAVAFVSKELADVELPEAVRAAARGERFVSPRIAAGLEALYRSLTKHALTAREADVLWLIALGYTNREIARKLRLSPRMVETHRAHIHRKLGLSTRAELVRYALRRGLLGA